MIGARTYLLEFAIGEGTISVTATTRNRITEQDRAVPQPEPSESAEEFLHLPAAIAHRGRCSVPIDTTTTHGPPNETLDESWVDLVDMRDPVVAHVSEELVGTRDRVLNGVLVPCESDSERVDHEGVGKVKRNSLVHQRGFGP